MGSGAVRLAATPSPDAASAAGERFRFMLEAAAGVSLIFALTLMLSMASILLLTPCRT